MVAPPITITGDPPGCAGPIGTSAHSRAAAASRPPNAGTASSGQQDAGGSQQRLTGGAKQTIAGPCLVTPVATLANRDDNHGAAPLNKHTLTPKYRSRL